MAIESLEVRMARLQGAYEQINERLAGVEREVTGLRSDLRAATSELRSQIAGVKSETNDEIGSLRMEMGDLRKQVQTQFYWTLTLILGSILIPILRDLLP